MAESSKNYSMQNYAINDEDDDASSFEFTDNKTNN